MELGSFVLLGHLHTHTGFLPKSDPAPVVEFSTRIGIVAAGGQFDFERCTKKMFVHRNRRRNLLVLLYLRRKYKIHPVLAVRYLEGSFYTLFEKLKSNDSKFFNYFRMRQMKRQLDAILCRFYFCRVTLHVSGASAHHQEYLKLVQLPLVHVLKLQVSHHNSLLGPVGPNKEL